jgi:hypothetical protein
VLQSTVLQPRGHRQYSRGSNPRARSMGDHTWPHSKQRMVSELPLSSRTPTRLSSPTLQRRGRGLTFFRSIAAPPVVRPVVCARCHATNRTRRSRSHCGFRPTRCLLGRGGVRREHCRRTSAKVKGVRVRCDGWCGPRTSGSLSHSARVATGWHRREWGACPTPGNAACGPWQPPVSKSGGWGFESLRPCHLEPSVVAPDCARTSGGLPHHELTLGHDSSLAFRLRPHVSKPKNE